MVRGLVVAAVLLAMGPAPVAGASGVSASQAAVAGTEQVLFRAGTGGYGCYRIPALARTEQGSLLAFAEARKSPSGADRGDIVLRRSTDDGRTWGPVPATFDGINDGWFATGPGRGVALRNGRLVVGAHQKPSNGVVDAGVLYSDDHGDSWHASQVSNSFVDGELSPGEISVAELADGRLCAAGRNEITSGDHRAAAISADGGTTFPAFALTLSRAGGRRRDAVRAEPGRRGRRLHQHHVVQVLGHREQCQPGTGVEGGADAIGPVQGQAGLADAGTAGEDADADGRAGPVGQVGSDVSALTTSATPTDGGFPAQRHEILCQ